MPNNKKNRGKPLFLSIAVQKFFVHSCHKSVAQRAWVLFIFAETVVPPRANGAANSIIRWRKNLPTAFDMEPNKERISHTKRSEPGCNTGSTTT